MYTGDSTFPVELSLAFLIHPSSPRAVERTNNNWMRRKKRDKNKNGIGQIELLSTRIFYIFSAQFK